MKIYKLYRVNPNVLNLLKQYPDIKAKLITLEPTNTFFTNQMECFFTNNDSVSDYIEYKLKDRYDYTRNINIHTINNQLTKEKIVCQVYEYYIIIIASQKSNIFFDILYQISKSYVIMEEQFKNTEV